MAEISRSALGYAGDAADAQSSWPITRGSSGGLRLFHYHHILVQALAVCLSFCIGQAKAAEAESKPEGPPNIERGAVIAAEGIQQASACAECHAFNGSSDGSGAFPRITGLPADYFKSQLRDFASGIRNSAIMSPIAKSLSPEEINDVTAYYASVNAPFLPLKSASPAVIKSGRAARDGWRQREGHSRLRPMPRA